VETATPQTDAPEQGGAQPEAENKPPKGVQKRLDEMRRQIGDTQRLNERLVNILERSIAQGKPPSADQKPSGPPKREDFQDFESYSAARADFEVAQAVTKAEARVKEAQVRQAAEAAEKDWTDRVAKAAEKYEDFEEVAFSDSLPVTDAMAVAMRELKAGPEIAYWLGKHPAEARRIASMSAVAQVVEIGKIEDRISEDSKPKREVSKAPAPIQPIGKAKASDNELRDDLPMDEWVRRREAQLKSSRR